jgi:predicted 2-oxoglutarate/Fe(II)-dependent dioxygenase YbiX
MNQLKDYILVVPNIVPEALCDLVISEYENQEGWQDAAVGALKLNKSIRNCKIIQIFSSKIDQDIFKCASKAINSYLEAFPDCVINQDSGYELLKYTEGGFYSQHTDASSNYNRSISCSFALNDEFEGGEFAFFNKELKYKIPKGAAIMFPANFVYPHEIMPISSGTRYSIITWFK